MPSSPLDRDRNDPDDGLLANSAPGDNAPALSVSELSGALKRTVEDSFGMVRVRGEISGFKRAASGHCYLCLKDDKAVLDGVIWRGAGGRAAAMAEDGLDVVASGRLTTYPGRSKYQIVIDRLELAGQGALMQLLETRRQALAVEGLFDPARKKALPVLPRTIGVITSPTGAVIRDILHRLADRMPSHVVVWPVIVQGEGAAEQVATAIHGFDAMTPDGQGTRPELLIVARGGGSIEDLWAFNEEVVVRAVAECSIPLISAVGHETDTTLCDFAADVRAPTPTAAAEIAVPVRADLLAGLADSGLRADRAIRRHLGQLGERLQGLARLLPRPAGLFSQQRQRHDEFAERLPRALGARLALARGAFDRRADRLRLDLVRQRAGAASDKLLSTVRLLAQLHPNRPLERGYARITSRDNEHVGRTADARRIGALTLHFADGAINGRVENKGPASYAGRGRSRPAAPGQDDLFEPTEP